MLGPVWERLLADEPELAEMFAQEPAADLLTAGEPGAGARPVVDLATWLDQCRDLLGRYFLLEDPQRLEPTEREVHVVSTLDSGLLIHGYIDRLDLAPTGELRIVDYKTGRSPGERFEAKALFQMKFYALVVWRTRGVIPTLLQLIYLGNGEMLRYQPDEADLLATERKVDALWSAIRRADESGEWRPNKTPLCAWCDHRRSVPAWGGTPPPLPSGCRTPRLPREATSGATVLLDAPVSVEERAQPEVVPSAVPTPSDTPAETTAQSGLPIPDDAPESSDTSQEELFPALPTSDRPSPDRPPRP